MISVRIQLHIQKLWRIINYQILTADTIDRAKRTEIDEAVFELTHVETFTNECNMQKVPDIEDKVYSSNDEIKRNIFQ